MELDRDVVETAGLRFVTLYRHFRGDQGPSAEVHVRTTAGWREALRYDCLQDDPHWHALDAAGGDMRHVLEAPAMDTNVERIVKALETDLGTNLYRAGYPDAAATAADLETHDAVALVAERLRAVLTKHAPGGTEIGPD